MEFIHGLNFKFMHNHLFEQSEVVGLQTHTRIDPDIKMLK